VNAAKIRVMQVCANCGTENPDHARFCLACGNALEPPAAGEERKVVSILFVDLVGFTDRSDRADPEDVRATLRPYHARVKADIERFGGTVEKFIGDGVLAVFGAPVAHEDDAERAVRAGLRVLETMDDLRNDGLDVSVRAAVTTGEAVVALGARLERGEGIVAGDVVNTAARLQAAASPGTVIVDETTMRSSEAAIAFEALPPVEAKGKAEPIPIWLALDARSRVGEAEMTTQTPFVGREHERAVLLESFLRVERESAVQLVTIVGEPGIGKSRLVAELRTSLDDRPELITWRHGRCLPYGEGITFWALGEAVKEEAGILESDDQAEAAAKLEQAVAAVFEDASEREWLASRLGPLVGAGGEAGAVGRDEAFTSWRRFLEAMAARRPVVLVVEDLHWADNAMLDFLEHVLDWGAPVPLLVLATTRPELFDRRADWGGGRRNATTISLSPLSSDETARLLQGLLERAVLPAETQVMLLEKAGGNPLYTEQFASMLSERGDAGGLAVPETVQALIAARLDTLSPELKALLQDACVVGRSFWTGAVAALGGRSQEDVLAGVRELVRREFVRPARVSSFSGEDEFSIWHALVREVAYSQIPRAPRSEKHEAAAAWIEEQARERLPDHAEIIVHHYEQALTLARAAGDERPDLREALARFLLLAGGNAMHLDVGAAETAFRRALELSEDASARGAVLGRLGEALQEQGRLPESEQVYEEAIAALRGAGDERGAAVVGVGLGRALWRHGKTERARVLTEDAIEVLEHEPGPDLVVAYERMAALDALGGRSQQAIEWAEKGLALARQQGIENVVRHLQMRGLARIDSGDFAGLEDVREGLAVALRLNLGIETATSYLNLGEMVGVLEDLGAGLELSEASLAFARRRGLTHHVMWTRAARLWYLFGLGRWDELLREADEILRWDRKQGGTQIELNTLIATTPVLAHRGRLDEAARDAAIFLPRSREVGDPQTLGPALLQAALVSAVRGDLAEAVALVEEVEAFAQERVEIFGGLTVMVQVCVAAGELEIAERLIRDSSSRPASIVGLNSLRDCRAVLAEARGDFEEAAASYREAAEGWGAFGSVFERAYALHGLGRCGDEAAAREAAAIFEQLGAAPFSAVARAA
jgi:class 3 adenylate cyclase/tetratricopeptide (TPR) repeat protein